MLEKILISLATSLFEKLGKYLMSKWDEHKAEEKEHERIGNTVGRLIEAETPDEVRSAFGDLA